MTGWQYWHNASIHHTQSLDLVNLEAQIDNSPQLTLHHSDSSNGMRITWVDVPRLK